MTLGLQSALNCLEIAYDNGNCASVPFFCSERSVNRWWYPYRSHDLPFNLHALGLRPARNGTLFRTTVMSNSIPSLPADLKQFAFLLDVDGTILDLAPTPREVF